MDMESRTRSVICALVQHQKAQLARRLLQNLLQQQHSQLHHDLQHQHGIKLNPMQRSHCHNDADWDTSPSVRGGREDGGEEEYQSKLQGSEITETASAFHTISTSDPFVTHADLSWVTSGRECEANSQLVAGYQPFESKSGNGMISGKGQGWVSETERGKQHSAGHSSEEKSTQLAARPKKRVREEEKSTGGEMGSETPHVRGSLSTEKLAKKRRDANFYAFLWKEEEKGVISIEKDLKEVVPSTAIPTCNKTHACAISRALSSSSRPHPHPHRVFLRAREQVSFGIKSLQVLDVQAWWHDVAAWDKGKQGAAFSESAFCMRLRRMGFHPFNKAPRPATSGFDFGLKRSDVERHGYTFQLDVWARYNQ
mmetsp:Transcript_69949/g.145829  ORF Transcript_69949/g.145829 Transcript_69949/m.145829 type:complete len:368 (+) Transcript_69949:218-1321(+)|eukprot:CAMPEP_0181293140 /NCGR_PEP_ID=MMETSP1101-20121128/2902_1 /TAXON_ID=46948 /ORGANISM="Rhodomonas abbreviata, Strain Caron Lab Isolate" /LENGTH=367 /DNA_ID=CAMNT_0023397699 /DNA_START=211 /DNA_END=1314 /DNA_ORIENTATION=-